MRVLSAGKRDSLDEKPIGRRAREGGRELRLRPENDLERRGGEWSKDSARWVYQELVGGGGLDLEQHRGSRMYRPEMNVGSTFSSKMEVDEDFLLFHLDQSFHPNQIDHRKTTSDRRFIYTAQFKTRDRETVTQSTPGLRRHPCLAQITVTRDFSRRFLLCFPVGDYLDGFYDQRIYGCGILCRLIDAGFCVTLVLARDCTK